MGNQRDVNNTEQHIIDQLKVEKTVIPDDVYFQNLKTTLFEQIAEKPTPKLVPLYKRWYSWTAIAAGIALLLTVVLWSPNVPQQTHPELDFSSLRKSEILDYLHENIDDVETDQLAEQLHEIPSPLSNVATQTIDDVASILDSDVDDLFEGIQKDEILEYLEDQDLDEDLLLGS
jgi:hypothetical protein